MANFLFIRPTSEGGKKTVFLVNTVTLVDQHYSTIKRHTDLNVEKFSGDMNVDYWTKEDWDTKLAPSQVIVLTAQIFLDICLHHYFSKYKIIE